MMEKSGTWEEKAERGRSGLEEYRMKRLLMTEDGRVWISMLWVLLRRMWEFGAWSMLGGFWDCLLDGGGLGRMWSIVLDDTVTTCLWVQDQGRVLGVF